MIDRLTDSIKLLGCSLETLSGALSTLEQPGIFYLGTKQETLKVLDCRTESIIPGEA